MVPSSYTDNSNEYFYMCHLMTLIYYNYTALGTATKMFCFLCFLGPLEPWECRQHVTEQMTRILNHMAVKTSKLTFHSLFLINQKVSRSIWSHSDVNFCFYPVLQAGICGKSTNCSVMALQTRPVLYSLIVMSVLSLYFMSYLLN